MISLATTQALSLTTKAVTTVLGIAQAFLVIHFLSRAEYGLVGLVMSIGGVVGVTQHLGVVDGAIREIAVLNNKRDVGKVFWVSHLVRQAVTIPLTLLLLAAAGVVATTIYGRSEIIPYIQLFAGSLILQGLQDVFGATLTGRKQFIALYAVQIITAVINVIAFGYLTWQFGIRGFFWAVLVTTAIMIVLLAAIVARDLRGCLRLPNRRDIIQFARRVMRVGLYMYLSRILFVVWQRLPLLLLGGVLAADQLGDLTLSLTFGSRLTIIAMALSEVNLSWMSSLFAAQRDEFVRAVTRNLQRLLVLMMTLTLALIFFTPEILRLPILADYWPARQLVVVMTVAFFLYALVDIATSSVFVSADRPRMRLGVYALMTATSLLVIGVVLLLTPDPFRAALGVLLGAVAAYLATVLLAQQMGVTLLTGQLGVFVTLVVVSAVWLLNEPTRNARVLVFAVLAAYTAWEAYRAKIVPTAWVSVRPAPTNGAAARTTPADAIICFAGAFIDAPTWTNRQHIMSRVARRYPVLYVEPRVWVVKAFARMVLTPEALVAWLWRLVWYRRRGQHLYVVSQWNLIPGSRESDVISRLNHWLNRWHVMGVAWWLGMLVGKPIVWLYDTEAAEYLSAFPQATVVYDCVDDHAAQAGPDRNSRRVEAEEAAIMRRADLVTVTSARLLAIKRPHNRHTCLVLNAGDVALYERSPVKRALARLSHPILGTVGALDSYKLDFPLLLHVARARPQWQLVFIGEPIVERSSHELNELKALPNTHWLGGVPRERAAAFVHAFDVCLIPYRDSRYNAASFPLKFWEFMATGKPIVVSGLPELKAYVPLIAYAEGAAEFVAAVERALTSHQGSEERRALAQPHSFEQRVTQLLALVEEVRGVALRPAYAG